MKLRAQQKQTGFTIVELLIVIVVIAILAAISIVAYNGIQNRANISSIDTSLTQINKAVSAYYALNGTYPSTGSNWWTQTDANKNTFIPGLSPELVSSLPRALQWSGTPTFYYISDGADYQLLYLYPGGTQFLPDSARNDDQVKSMLAPGRSTRGWGYWTPGGIKW